MNTAQAAALDPDRAGFEDGLGIRTVTRDAASGDPIETLALRPELTAVPSFEFALRERTARVANFRHAYFARVRRVDRLPEHAGHLALVSEHVEGTRLFEILRAAGEHRLTLDINAALCLIRQLVPAVALLHENARDVAHGALAPERLVVTPHARLVVVEHVLGAALEQLEYTRDRLWRELRVAMPPAAGLPRFDQRADVTQIGAVALALVLGRPLTADEYPGRALELLHEAQETSVLGHRQPLSAELRGWLSRTLQLDPRRPFLSAREAQLALEELLGQHSTYVPAPLALEAFLDRYRACAAPAPPAPAGTIPEAAAQLDRRDADPRPETAPVAHSVAPAAGPATPGPGSVKPASSAASSPAPPPPRTASAASGGLTPSPQSAVLNPREPDGAAGGRLGANPPSSVPTAQEPDAAARGRFDTNPQSAIRHPQSDLPPFLRPAGAADVPSPPQPLFDPDEPFTAPPDIIEEPRRTVHRRRVWNRRLLLVPLLLVVALGGWLGAQRFGHVAVEPGSLAIESNPSGVDVYVDGVHHGTTPLTLSLDPGAHVVELRGRGAPRVMPLTIAAGARLSHYVELTEAPRTGGLQIRTDPAGAHVIVDGQPRGSTPITLVDLEPGDHQVVLEAGGRRVEHQVAIEAGATASLVVPLLPSGPVSGWLAVAAPVAMEIYQGGQLIGTSQSERIMLPAGRHQLELMNETLGFRTTRVVQVPPGRVATLRLEMPTGIMHLNAIPWAEVWLDGERVGETPIGNISVPIGPHEIVFRHPDLGERRYAATVTLAGPTRVSVDMRR